MRSPITKVAAAATIVLVASLSIVFMDKAASPVYGLNQTIEANRSVRSIHIKWFDSPHVEPKEYWVQCDEYGNLKSARWHMPQWDAPEDGAKVVVWKGDKIHLWFKGTAKKKGCLVTYAEAGGADWVYRFAKVTNPKLAVERLYEQQEQGKVKIEVDQPEDETKAIMVTATHQSGVTESGKRQVLFVDPKTRLVTAVETYRLKDGEYEYEGVHKFYDYNQPIDPAMFDLDKQVPANVKRVDNDSRRIDLNKGINPDELERYADMAPKEMTRAFFQACGDEDWDELVKFMPDSEVSQRARDYYGGLEIINIGEPFKSEAYHGLFVPYEVRLKSGRIKKWNLAVTNRNLVGRYMCDGGF
ncbi:MAG: hypothetical protein ACYSWO_14995 [Planctomycetota bacterium]